MKSRHLVPQKLNKVNEEENEEVSTDLLFDRLIEYKNLKGYRRYCYLDIRIKGMHILKSLK